jgi:hypothetical protein
MLRLLTPHLVLMIRNISPGESTFMVRSIFAALLVWAVLGLGSTGFAANAEGNSGQAATTSNGNRSNNSSNSNNQNHGGGYYYTPNYYYRGSGILDRPNRPGHPVGNTIRAFFGRG